MIFKKLKNRTSKKGILYKIYGTVCNELRQPVPEVIVRMYNKTIRGRIILGEAITREDGSYIITYILENIRADALVAGVYDTKNRLLRESKIYYNAPAKSCIDINLGDMTLWPAFVNDELFNQRTNL